MFFMGGMLFLKETVYQGGPYVTQNTLFHGTKNCKSKNMSLTWARSTFWVGHVLEGYVLRRMDAT